MLLVPPNTHNHSSHTDPSCVKQANTNSQSSSSSSSPGHPSPHSPPIIKQEPQYHQSPLKTSSTDNLAAVSNGQPQPHMSGLSEAHYSPVSTAAASSQPLVSGRSPQAPSTPRSAPGTPASTTPTSTTRPSSGGSASGGSASPITTNSVFPMGVAGGLSSAAGGGGVVTTGSGGTGGNSAGPGTGWLPPAMLVPGPSVTSSGGSPGQLPQHHPLLGYVPHGANKMHSKNINGTHVRGGSDVLPSPHHGSGHHPPGPYSGGPGGGSPGGSGTGAGGGSAQPPVSPASAYHSRSKQSPVTCESGGSVGDKKNTMVAVTSQPSNESELQLYRVLQRANLLNYFDTFISQGGDDVQQLCEAGEDEFLEIMALVGMASKPLHVRRLQKALQEWVSNPGLFLMPLKSPAPAPTSSMPPQLDTFNILSSLTTTYRQHHQQPQSSNITQSSRARIPPNAVGSVAAAAAAAVAAAAPHTAPYRRPQPYPSPESLSARKSPPSGGVAPQPGSVSPTDYMRILEAAWAMRVAGQQDPRSSPPGGKISPPDGMNSRSTWHSTMSHPSSNRSPGHHTDTLHNSSESQPFLPGTPVP